MEKDGKRFPKTGGSGYAVYNYDAAANKFQRRPQGSSGLRTNAPRRRQGERLHLWI